MTEAYPGGSASVRNSLPEPRDLQRGYAARQAPPGGPEKESGRWGQAGRPREAGTSAGWVRQIPPRCEALGGVLWASSPSPDMRLPAAGPMVLRVVT